MFKVLIVDDEPFILEGLKMIISWEEYGLEIIGQAENGMEALEFIKKNHIDILITDITMPQMNGLQLIDNAKGIRPDIKCVVLSGYNDFDYVKQGIRLGIENYLLKPVTVKELIATIENISIKIEKSKNIARLEEVNNKILRNNILYRWVTNSIDNFELEERAKLLEIEINYDYYLACSISVLSENNVEEMAERQISNNIYNKIDHICKTFCSHEVQNTCSMCFCDYDGDFIIIFGINEPVNRYTILKKVYDILEAIKMQFQIDLLITIGDTQSTYTQLFNSYYNAKKLKEYSLIHNDKFIIDYDEMNKVTSEHTSQYDINSKDLSKIIVSGTEQEISDYIDNIYDKTLKEEQLNPYDVQNFTIEIILAIRRIIRQFNDKNDYAKIFKSILELQTIDQVKKYVKNFAINNSADYESRTSQYSPVVKQMINYMNDHLEEDISLKQLGDLLNANSTYLGQIFKKETGEFFTEYVNKKKMENAKRLVIESNLKIADICRKLGFDNQNYFYTQFKKYNGVSPSELRGYKKKCV